MIHETATASVDLPSNGDSVLLVAAKPMDASVLQWLSETHPGKTVTLLPIHAKANPGALPDGWTLLTLTDLGSIEELRLEYLRYLETVPETTIRESDTLNKLFHRRDGYSLWWTDVGVRRSPTQGMFLKIKAVWMITRAIAQTKPATVVLHCADSREATILFSAAKQARRVVFSPTSVLPADSSMVSLWRWFRESVIFMFVFAFHRIWRYLALRRRPPLPAPVKKNVGIAMAALYPRHLSYKDGVPGVWYWEHLTKELATQTPAAAIRYLMDLGDPDAWPLRFNFQYLLKDSDQLAAVPEIVPLWRGHTDLRTWAATWLHQLKMVYRYYRLETHPRFRSIFRFHDVDFSFEWIFELRHSINLAVWWESEVDAAASILRQCGNIKVVLVHQEFEPRGMILIAACRRLGIKTIGVQHGTFYPLHTIYTPPIAQIDSTPTPDYYAVYGEFSKEVVSRFGHYPADKVLICAGARFDALVNHPPNPRDCRRRLNLPEGAFIILVTTQNYPWFREAVRAVLAAAPVDSLVCVKTFPGDMRVYQEMIEASGRKDALVFTDRFDDLLGACDILVSASSTTVLEATLVGKPTICLNFSTEPFYYPYVEEGVSVGVCRPEDLGAALKQMREFKPDAQWQERRLHFLRRHLGPAVDGTAAATFASHVQGALT